MKPISGIVNSISELIGQLTLPTREKKELEIGLLKLIQELERELTQARAVTVQETYWQVPLTCSLLMKQVKPDGPSP